MVRTGWRDVRVWASAHMASGPQHRPPSNPTCHTPGHPLYAHGAAHRAHLNQPRNAASLPQSLRGGVPARRSDMKLNELSDNPGATKKSKRVGRGPGSGKGKMGGRGIKGQKSRSGVAISAYEGGQMPLYQRLPKRGFNKPNRKEFAVVNLGLIQKFVEAGKLGEEITETELVDSGLVRRKLDGVRVLASGDFSAAARITVTGASKSAVEAVEKAGGTLTVTSAPDKAAASE